MCVLPELTTTMAFMFLLLPSNTPLPVELMEINCSCSTKINELAVASLLAFMVALLRNKIVLSANFSGDLVTLKLPERVIRKMSLWLCALSIAF